MPITGAELREILHEHAEAGPADALRRAHVHRRIQRARRRRALGAAAGGVAVLVAVALATGVLPGLRGDRTAVASGRTTATLTPSAVSKPPTREQLDTTRDLLLHRFAALHLPTRAVTVNPDGTLAVDIAAKVPAEELRALVAPGGLTVRPVLDITTDHPSTQYVIGSPPYTEPTLEDVRARVGVAAYGLAAQLHQVPTDAATLDVLAAFGTLTPDEVAVLPATVQFYVPSISCSQLNARDPFSVMGVGHLDQPVVACGPAQPGPGWQKYLLSTASIGPSDVVAADSRYDAPGMGGWYVEAYVTGPAVDAWRSFTAAHVGDQIAMLVGTTVITAPQLDSQLDAPIVIPRVNQVTAPRLATVLDNGPLPVDFVVTDLRQ